MCLKVNYKLECFCWGGIQRWLFDKSNDGAFAHAWENVMFVHMFVYTQERKSWWWRNKINKQDTFSPVVRARHVIFHFVRVESYAAHEKNKNPSHHHPYCYPQDNNTQSYQTFFNLLTHPHICKTSKNVYYYYGDVWKKVVSGAFYMYYERIWNRKRLMLSKIFG